MKVMSLLATLSTFQLYTALPTTTSSHTRTIGLEEDCHNYKQSLVELGSASKYAILGGLAIVSSGLSTVTGDIGTFPGAAVTGFPAPGQLDGSIHPADASATHAITDLTTAMNAVSALTTCGTIKIGNLGGMTLHPGLYTSDSTMGLAAGDLTLDAQGDSDAVFIFKMATSFISTAALKVKLIGGAQSKNIFWLVGTSVTLGATSEIEGTMMAGVSITMGGAAKISGRMLAKTGTVTLDAASIQLPASPVGDFHLH